MKRPLRLWNANFWPSTMRGDVNWRDGSRRAPPRPSRHVDLQPCERGDVTLAEFIMKLPMADEPHHLQRRSPRFIGWKISVTFGLPPHRAQRRQTACKTGRCSQDLPVQPLNSTADLRRPRQIGGASVGGIETQFQIQFAQPLCHGSRFAIRKLDAIDFNNRHDIVGG